MLRANMFAEERPGSWNGEKALQISELKEYYSASCFWEFLDPLDQSETYHSLNEHQIEHMNETC